MWNWLSFENIGNLGKLAGGVGQAYGAVQQSKMANKMFDLQKENYDREVTKENETQNNLDTAIANVYGDKKKKTSSAGIAQFNLGA